MSIRRYIAGVLLGLLLSCSSWSSAQSFKPERCLSPRVAVYAKAASLGDLLNGFSTAYDRLGIAGGEYHYGGMQNRLPNFEADFQLGPEFLGSRLTQLDGLDWGDSPSREDVEDQWRLLFPGEAFYALVSPGSGEFASLFGVQTDRGFDWKQELLAASKQAGGMVTPWKRVGGYSVYHVKQDGLYFCTHEDWLLGSDSSTALLSFLEQVKVQPGSDGFANKNRLYRRVASDNQHDLEVFVDHRKFIEYANANLKSRFDIDYLSRFPVLDVGTGFYLDFGESKSELLRFRINRTVAIPFAGRDEFINNLQPIGIDGLPDRLPDQTGWVYLFDDPTAEFLPKLFEIPLDRSSWRPGLSIKEGRSSFEGLSNRKGFAVRKGPFLLFAGLGEWSEFFGSFTPTEFVEPADEPESTKPRLPGQPEPNQVAKVELDGRSVQQFRRHGRLKRELELDGSLLTFVELESKAMDQAAGGAAKRPQVLESFLNPDSKRTSFIDLDWVREQLKRESECLIFEATARKIPGLFYLVPAVAGTQIWGAPGESPMDLGTALTKADYLKAYQQSGFTLLSDFWFRVRFVLSNHGVIYQPDQPKHVTYLFHRRLAKGVGLWQIDGVIRRAGASE